jgi:carbon-monoxide dehydrogenase small subunit
VHELTLQVTVNGTARTTSIEPRRTLVDFLRETCDLTGTHVGCEHGICGACTVLLDGQAVRACLLFAVQAADRTVTTIEGLTPDDGTLSPIQEAFRAEHALQCGFCTPGFVVTLTALRSDAAVLSDDELRCALSGNLCRCTGYEAIVRAARRAGIGTGSGSSDATTARNDGRTG